MLGAVAGDVIGSVYEARPIKTVDFPLFSRGSRFTDDTVCTVAVAHAILKGGDYGAALREFALRHPDAGYGGMFLEWVLTPGAGPYNSWGNGSAMRASPVGWAFDTAEEVLRQAGLTALPTHNHPEGVLGAGAAALAVYLARTGSGKEEIRGAISRVSGYDLGRTLDEIRPAYAYDPSCRGTVPVAITAFLESTDYEDAVRKAVSLGGDSDTLACIAGSVAEAFYGGVPGAIADEVRGRLPEDLLAVIEEFEARHGP
ncbi:MAG: ADP-ribosylglycohydrolase family protein [Thermodesulfobacteriota bacterium]